MNFVKGFLRRASASQSVHNLGVPAENRISTPFSWPDVQFSNDGTEKKLKRMWKNYQDAASKAEERNAWEAFLVQFIQAFENWVPTTDHLVGAESSESSQQMIVGCFFGHPTGVIISIIQELKHTILFIAQLHTNSETKEPSLKDYDMEASLRLLNALTIISNSPHNRTVFSSCGGLQVLTSLMKTAVVHLKSIASDVTTEQGSSVFMLLSFLQCLLSHIVSISAKFIHTEVQADNQVRNNESNRVRRLSLRQRRSFTAGEITGVSASAAAPLLETGGLNWFVELLRSVRRLRLKVIITDTSLEKLTLQTLKEAIATDSRVQNHLRSIGGLEVLLDGLGIFPSSMDHHERVMDLLLKELYLQVLSLEVIREAVYRNANSLQSLRELGGVLKLVQMFRSAAFLFPERLMTFPTSDLMGSMEAVVPHQSEAEGSSVDYADDLLGWNPTVSYLCKVLFSFLMPSSEDGPQDPSEVTGIYWESATRLVINVLLGVFGTTNESDTFRSHSSGLQRKVISMLRQMLALSPAVLRLFREEGVWTALFSESFFYFGFHGKESFDTQPLQLDVISFVELAATTNGTADNLLECDTLIQALEQCIRHPNIVTMLLKSLHRILQLSPESTGQSFKQLDVMTVLSEIMGVQLQSLKSGINIHQSGELLQSREAVFSLFNEYLSTEEVCYLAAKNMKLMDVLFSLICDSESRNFAVHHLSNFMKLAPKLEEHQDSKTELCMKYLETLSRIQTERHATGISVLLDLLSILRDVIQSDFSYYQALFREVECFVHIVSLLNEAHGEYGIQLSLEVIVTLIHLLKGNEASKLAFRVLVGPGYKMLHTLLSDCYDGHPSEAVMSGLLDMLVDGKFQRPGTATIQNEDVIILFFNMIRQCDKNYQIRGLQTFLQLLEESTANQSACVRAGLLCFLLDWFSSEEDELVLQKVARLMHLVGGHSMTGKEIRRIFSLLRSTIAGSNLNNGKLLLSTFKAMLKEQGPTVFFEMNGSDSGIVVTTPFRWPSNRGFTFFCWIRLESCSKDSMMGLFSFLTETGKGSTAFISANKFTIETLLGHKKESLSIDILLKFRQWHFLCITHSTGRLSAGNLVKVYVDGILAGSEKLRYTKVYDPVCRCTIGASAPSSLSEDGKLLSGISYPPLCGQLGPVYLFDEVLSSEQVQSVYALGAGYMYAFLSSEVGCMPSSQNDVLFHSKEGLASKMIFGYNAQASAGRNLFDVSPISEQLPDRVMHEATIMTGTQLCYRRLVQNNILCVGGISVFLPLLTRLQQPVKHTQLEEMSLRSTQSADVVELLTAVLVGNYANQKFLLSSNGLSVFGFLLKFLPAAELSVKFVSALSTLLSVLAQSNDVTLSETLVKEAILKIYLNAGVWICTPYAVQRELYLSLINFMENHNYMSNICGLSRFLEIVQKFYWDKFKVRRNGKHKRPSASERPHQDEVSQLRILVLTVAEGVVRHRITVPDTKALINYIDRCEDLVCVEDVLQMLVGLLYEKDFLSSFLDSLHVLGGFHIFLSLLKRQQESVRLLALHILTMLCSAVPAEKKSHRIFGIGGGLPKGGSYSASIWASISDQLTPFPLTNVLRTTLFDILLGGGIRKQILQGGLLSQFGKSNEQRNWLTQTQYAGNPARTSTFPQFISLRVLGIILKFVVLSEDLTSRHDVLKDVLVMLESNPTNCEAIMQEPTWQEWVFEVLVNERRMRPEKPRGTDEEEFLVRKILAAVHVYAVCNMRGGWRQLERTCSYVRMYADKTLLLVQNWLCDLLADVVEDVLYTRAQTLLVLQPARDNVLYILFLIDELAVRDALQLLPFSCDASTEESQDSSLLSGAYVDLGFSEGRKSPEEVERVRPPKATVQPDGCFEDRRWRLYDKVWNLLIILNGKGQGVGNSSPPHSAGPTLGQRARGLVESLNVPAAEVAAAVTGGLGSVGININVPAKLIEKTVKLRGEKFSRLAFRLLLLYIYKAEFKAVTSAVQQFLQMLPGFMSVESEQNKTQLHLLLWHLLDARTQVGDRDEGARYHLISQLIQESLAIGGSVLASSIADRGGSRKLDSSETSSLYKLLQQDRVIAAVRDEKKSLRVSNAQWSAEVDVLCKELKEKAETEAHEAKKLEEQAQSIMNSLCSSEITRRAAYQLKCDEEEQAIANHWCLMFRNLTDERGPWSPASFPSENPVWWKLDKTEDPLRRRLKLRRNYHFNQTLLRSPSSLARSSAVDETSEDRSSREVVTRDIKAFLLRDVEVPEDDEEMHDAKDEFEKEAEPETSSNFNEENIKSEAAGEEEVIFSVSCVLVGAKRKLAGKLEITQFSLHFHVEFIIEGTGGSMVFNSSGELQNEETDENSSHDGNNSLDSVKKHRKWDILQVAAIYETRYLLRHTALEIFFTNSTPSVFLNFQSQQIAKDVALKIASCRNGKPTNAKDKASRVHYVDRKKAIELAEKARDCWRRREYSNFEYLMILNTLSGRSYNDLTQYPVFPWILAEYSSETLDLSDPSIYRDLSKPIGALEEKRFKIFQERYNNFSDPDIPNFYYGSHYSSMGIVLFYLLRLEPYTTLHRTLQGGKFDHADRLFHNIQSVYSNCLTNSSDVKELIPEFFYMPEMLTNTNKYYIGVRQDGQQLGDVILPAWAKGSPDEFIRIHRDALESEYVSEHLHEWIDLIFGYKQRGRPAIEAANVFYYLTYEGAVELEAMEDERQRAAVEDQIANFGQTPMQLFRKKHPKRGPLAPILRPFYYSPASITLTSSISSQQLSSGSPDSVVIFIGYVDGKIITVTNELIASTRSWLTPSLQSGGSFTFSSSQDLFFGLGSELIPPRRIGGYYAETLEVNSSSFALLEANSTSFLLTCGHWDNSFRLCSLSDGHMVQSICQHKDVVTCISVATDGSVVVTGSRDTTVMVWEVLSSSPSSSSSSMNRKRTSSNGSKQLQQQQQQQQQELIISDKPRSVLCGHDDAVTCVVVSSELDVVVSASSDGTCIVYTLRQGRYVRSLVDTKKRNSRSRRSISMLVVSSHHAYVLGFSNEDLTLHLWSLNGNLLGEVELNARVRCMQVSRCGEFVVCGGDQGYLSLRKMHPDLEIVRKYYYEGSCSSSSNSNSNSNSSSDSNRNSSSNSNGSSNSSSSCVCITPDDCFLVATREGKVLVFSVDTRLKSK